MVSIQQQLLLLVNMYQQSDTLRASPTIAGLRFTVVLEHLQ